MLGTYSSTAQYRSNDMMPAELAKSGGQAILPVLDHSGVHQYAMMWLLDCCCTDPLRFGSLEGGVFLQGLNATTARATNLLLYIDQKYAPGNVASSPFAG